MSISSSDLGELVEKIKEAIIPQVEGLINLKFQASNVDNQTDINSSSQGI